MFTHAAYEDRCSFFFAMKNAKTPEQVDTAFKLIEKRLYVNSLFIPASNIVEQGTSVESQAAVKERGGERAQGCGGAAIKEWQKVECWLQVDGGA